MPKKNRSRYPHNWEEIALSSRFFTSLLNCKRRSMRPWYTSNIVTRKLELGEANDIKEKRMSDWCYGMSSKDS